MLLQQERELVVEYGNRLVQTGLVTGTFGNVSVYNKKEGLFAISPSGMDYAHIRPADVVVLTPEGEKIDGDRKPSSETDMHRIFYQKRPDVEAVVHTHSTFATTLACLHWDIPPVHYLIAYAGERVPCAPYVTFGTYELAECAYATMGTEFNACLLGNHGMLAVGPTMSYAFDTAQQIEFVAELYYRTRCAGQPSLLSDEEIRATAQRFRSYRQA